MGPLGRGVGFRAHGVQGLVLGFRVQGLGFRVHRCSALGGLYGFCKAA